MQVLWEWRPPGLALCPVLGTQFMAALAGFCFGSFSTWPPGINLGFWTVSSHIITVAKFGLSPVLSVAHKAVVTFAYINSFPIVYTVVFRCWIATVIVMTSFVFNFVTWRYSSVLRCCWLGDSKGILSVKVPTSVISKASPLEDRGVPGVISGKKAD